ncbi:uncharacterized protein METZ01_LOCUS168375, partial [marine metagenome]
MSWNAELRSAGSGPMGRLPSPVMAGPRTCSSGLLGSERECQNGTQEPAALTRRAGLKESDGWTG